MEYTLDNFKFDSVTEESRGRWEQSQKDPGKGMFVINYSSILTRLIQVAGHICSRYASDLFIDWIGIDKSLKDRAYEGGRYLFGFRENGVDHAAYVLGRINGYGMQHFESQIKELYMLDITVMRAEGYPDDIEIRMCFGPAHFVADIDRKAA